MECYKGNALSNIQRSLAIVATYPEQVIVLKGTRDIVQLQAQGPHTLDALIDVQQTAGFKFFVRHVQAAALGDKDLQSQLVHLAEAAKAHFRQRRDDAAGVALAIRETARTFLPSQLAELRREGPLSQKTGEVVVKNVLLLTAKLFQAHPDVGSLPPADTLRGTFVFRFALAVQLLVVRWLSEGGIESVSMDVLGNDIVDMAYAAYATLFDGILSRDRKLLSLYEESTFFLDHVFRHDREIAPS